LSFRLHKGGGFWIRGYFFCCFYICCI